MTFRRLASVLGTIALVLAAHAGVASAHGVEVTADLDGTIATLELTDETGEVCVSVDPASEASAVAAVVDGSTDEVLLILGEGFGTTESCRFHDVDIVNGVLADVDAHRFVLAFGNDETSGVLMKPRLPDPPSRVGATESDGGFNGPVVFAVGASLGLALVVLRKRFLS